MPYYSPYAVISSMRGQGLGQALGQNEFLSQQIKTFLATVDPLSSDEAMKGYLAVWGQWAAARERTLEEWASTIDELVANKAATCLAIATYNKAAVIHWVEEVDMASKFIAAGASKSQVPVPPFPILFATTTRFVQKNTAFGPLQVPIPFVGCKRGDVFPDFSKLRILGPPGSVAGSLTKQGQELGLFGLPAWAAIVVVGVIAGGIVLSFRELRKLITREEIAKQKVEMLKTEVESDAARDSFQQSCMDKGRAAIGRELTFEENDRLVAQCLEVALKVNPLRKGQKIAESGLGMGLLLGGLGIAAVVGSFAYFRRQQQE